MTKKTKKTNLTETHLKELKLKYVQALKYNPDLWDKLQSPAEKFKESLRADLVETSLSNDDPMEAMRECNALAGLHDYWVCLKFALALNEIGRFFPVIPNLRQIKSWMSIAERIEECGKCGKSNRFPKLIFQAEDQGLLILVINLRYSNNAIIESLNRAIDYVLSLKDVKWREYKSGVPVLFDAEKEDYSFCKSQPIIEVAVQFSAGKMRIRQAVRELLDKYTPRETEHTTRFSSNTWVSDYKIYELHKDEGYSFKDISVKLNIPESTVKSAYQRIYLHIHQEDEYGTKETKGELCVNITGGSFISLEDAKNIYARAQMLGGPGNKIAPSGAYEDEEATFYDWKAELAESGKAFENWRKRFGQSIECWDCKRVPGSEACSGCSQALEPVYLARGLKRWFIVPGKVVPQSPKIDNVRNRKSEARWKELDNFIRLGIDRSKELSLQTDHIKRNGIEILPPGKEPKPEDDGAVRIIPHSSGQYSLTFTPRKDLLEWLIVNQIDLRRAKKAHN